MPNPDGIGLTDRLAGVRDPDSIGLTDRLAAGGRGKGTEGGGAGGPSPTIGMPRSSCGRDVRARGLLPLARDADRDGRGETLRSGSGIAMSAASSGKGGAASGKAEVDWACGSGGPAVPR